MLQKLIAWFIRRSPSTKRRFWKWWYNTFTTKAKDQDFKFMNYGYDEDGFYPELNSEDESERYPIHLYHHVVTQVDISGKRILEVGSGRGGGASYIVRYLNPALVHGIDISESAVELCNEIPQAENLSFGEGDSENVPFENETFDVVLNVESSHCYGDMNKFLSEVKRVLMPGGYFLWCDLRPVNILENLNKQFSKSGLELIQKTDITNNIIIALEKMSESRKASIREKVPKLIRKVFESYAGVKGSYVHDSFINGDLIYISASLKNPINT